MKLVLKHRIGVVGIRVVVIHIGLRILVEAPCRPSSRVNVRRLDDDDNCRPSAPNKVVKLDRRKVDRGWVTRGDPHIGQRCELLEEGVPFCLGEAPIRVISHVGVVVMTKVESDQLLIQCCECIDLLDDFRDCPPCHNLKATT